MTEKHWMQTFSGRRFFLPATADMFCVEDIAHSLAYQCRYAGHSVRHYSIAEHSVLLAHWLLREYGDLELARAGLMHDAAETYISDVPRPLKHQLHDFLAIEVDVENVLWTWVSETYKPLRSFSDPRLKSADVRICLDERQAVITPTPFDWNIPGGPLGVNVKGLTAPVAEALFLDNFVEFFGHI